MLVKVYEWLPKDMQCIHFGDFDMFEIPSRGSRIELPDGLQPMSCKVLYTKACWPNEQHFNWHVEMIVKFYREDKLS